MATIETTLIEKLQKLPPLTEDEIAEEMAAVRAARKATGAAGH